jgi:regulator of RNase E activity RraA
VPGTTNRLFETQISITCGDVTVNPGDFLFGDDDGVLVTTAEELEALIPVAEQVQRQEDRLLEQMSAGVSLLDMLNFEEHCANLREGRSSRLEFRF